MTPSPGTRRPLRINFLVLLILAVAVWNGLRLGETIFFWKTLAKYGAHPLYIAISGAVWIIAGLLLAWGLWLGKAWGWAATLVGTVGYTAWYWFDRLVIARTTCQLAVCPDRQYCYTADNLYNSILAQKQGVFSREMLMSENQKLQQLRDRKASTRLGGGPERIEAQHQKGKLTARERLDLLLDKGSFHETDPFVVHRTHDFGLEKQKYPGRQCRDRLGHH